mmetsp:Transcript_144587/g.367008  ORF Transcript_144587/g.367008 Transcript_144587/m.367008 type:complete len:233 (-) Transcript_144587:48-746(-)
MESFVQAAAMGGGGDQNGTHAWCEGLTLQAGSGLGNTDVVASAQLRSHEASVGGNVCFLAMLLQDTEDDVQHLHGVVAEQRGRESGDSCKQRRVCGQGRPQLRGDVRSGFGKLLHGVQDLHEVKLRRLLEALRLLPFCHEPFVVLLRGMLTELRIAGAAAVSLALASTSPRLRPATRRRPERKEGKRDPAAADEERVDQGGRGEHGELHPHQGGSLHRGIGNEHSGVKDRHL